MIRSVVLIAAWLGFGVADLVAGDAVAIGYNANGLWTAVTYYSSSTPPGGHDYRTEEQAREEATRDLRARAPEQLARVEILSASDSTGYVAIGRGRKNDGADENVVGRGKTQRAADSAALAQLKHLGATGKQRIVYRYFSYGGDSTR